MPSPSHISYGIVLLLVLCTPWIYGRYVKRNKATQPVSVSATTPPVGASLPPPTVPSSSTSAYQHVLHSPHLFTRCLYHLLPLGTQHWLRDHGMLRWLDHPTVVLGTLALTMVHPGLMYKRLQQHRAQEGRVLDVPYGPLDRQRLDVYQCHCTPSLSVPLSPVLLYVHGGAWGSGSKSHYWLLGPVFSYHCRCVCMVFNYRVWPDADIEGQLHDLRTAMEWIGEHAAEYGGDAQKLILVGHSSGAHCIALQLMRQAQARHTLAEQHQHKVMLPASVNVIGWIGLSGVYDLVEHRLFEARRGVHEVSPLTPANGGMDKLTDNSPTTIAIHMQQTGSNSSTSSSIPTGLLPPVLLIHGDSDQTVPDQQSRLFAASLGGSVVHSHVTITGMQVQHVLEATMDDADLDSPCVCVIFPGCDHLTVIMDLMTEQGVCLLQIIQRFVARVAKTQDDRVQAMRHRSVMSIASASLYPYILSQL